MEWKNISINKNQIKTETSKAVLFNMPHNSNYDGFVFWHPAKLVRNGKHSGAVSVGYTNEFVFKLKKYGNGRYNKFAVIDECEISVEEFEEAFGITDENITSREIKNQYETHKPETVEAVKIQVREELKDDE